MRHYLLATVLLFLSFSAIAQEPKELVKEGIALHDEGKFDEAIKKYDEAIAVDGRYYLAYYEKALSLMNAHRYEQSIELCKFILDKFPDGSENAAVYVNYGTCYDLMGKRQVSVEIYDKGIARYPDFGLLYFNKAITLYNMGKVEDAMAAIEISIQKNPYHASSHNVLAVLTEKDNRVFSLLASLVFLAIEPLGKRAEIHIATVEKILGTNVEKKDDKNVTITMVMPDDKKKNAPNDFHSVEMLMSLSVALNHSEELKHETRFDKLKRNLDAVLGMLSDSKKKKGFGWTYYAPFFTELKKKDYMTVFTHIIYASTPNEANRKWLEENQEQLKDFTAWFKSYWKKPE